MIRPSLLILTLALALSVPATATPRVKYDPAALASLQPGMAESDIVAHLGKPAARMTNADGRYALTFIRQRGGIFTSAKLATAILIFDKEGRFQRVAGRTDIE